MIDSDDRPRSAGHGACEIDVVASHDADRLVAAELLTIARRAAAHLGLGGHARVRLVLDAEMASMHEQYSGVSGTTDVLTFDLRDNPDPADPVLDVDVILCTDEARRQAEARRIPVVSELALYFIHALLHCTGHDDHDDDAYDRMHEAEDRVLAALGLGRIFASPAADAPRDSGGVP